MSRTKFVFDYSGLLKNQINAESVTLKASSGDGMSPSAFSIFSSHSANGDSRRAQFEPFRLLVVNESNSPTPLWLSSGWLDIAGKKNLEKFRDPLRKRLEQFQTGDLSWQLRPFINVGKKQPTDLYLSVTNYKPDKGSELDFDKAAQFLLQEQENEKKSAAEIRTKMTNELAQMPSIDPKLILGEIFWGGTTNTRSTSIPS